MPAISVPMTERGPKLLEEMTSAEVADALTRTDVALLATGAIEQHGAHLPLGTDWYLGTENCRRIVRNLAERGHQIVAYALPVGKSDLFRSYPGTLTLSNQTFVAVQREILTCLHHQGFRRFVLLCSNGGNQVASAMAAAEVYEQLGCPVLYVDPMSRPSTARQEILKNPKIESHAGEGETSVMLLTRPDLVDVSKATLVEPTEALAKFRQKGAKRMHDRWEEITSTGYIGDPRLAEAATGEKLISVGSAWIADAIEQEYFK